MSTTYEKERTLQRQIGTKVESALPGVEVLAVELSSPDRFTRLRRPPGGRRPRALRARHRRPARLPARVRDRRLLARARAPAAQAGALRAAPSAARSPCARTASKRLRGEVVAPASAPSRFRRGGDAVEIPYDADRARQSDRPKPETRTGGTMSQEIIEAVRTIEREKGIEPEHARQRARGRAARRVQEDPGRRAPRGRRARRRGRVPRLLDRDPADLEVRLLDEAMEAKIDELERLEEETGETPAHADLRGRPRPRLVAGARGADQARRRDPRQLRPHRRADGEAGDPAADPRGRARDDVRGVRRPRRARS